MTPNSNIPHGYKQTELGIIPEDWKEKAFFQIFEIFPNNTVSREFMNDSHGEVHNIHYGDVLIKYQTILDVEKCTIPYINSGVKIKSNKLVQSGDIIISDTAEDDTVGKCIEIKNISDNKIVAGLHTFFCRPIMYFASGWLGYYINSSNYHNQLLPYITGIKVSSISKASIQGTKLLVPPLAEQRAIAEALSDVDGLITALDKKIAKQQLIKQGAMQQLLSLLGQHEGWFNIKLKNIVNVRKGSMLTSDKFQSGNIPVIAGGKTPAGCHNIANRPSNTITVSASGASAGYVSFNKTPIFATDCSTIEPSSLYDIRYLYYLLKYKQSEIFAMQTGGAQPHIHPSDLYELQILFTYNIKEQQAIATILSDMDKEIAELEARRDKYRLIKSGMMQKLLTGQIRLK